MKKTGKERRNEESVQEQNREDDKLRLSVDFDLYSLKRTKFRILANRL